MKYMLHVNQATIMSVLSFLLKLPRHGFTQTKSSYHKVEHLNLPREIEPKLPWDINISRYNEYFNLSQLKI